MCLTENVYVCVAFAAARIYDRAMLRTREPSELHKNLNFPVQDYIAADSSDISKAAAAAMTHSHRAQTKPSGKRPLPPPDLAPHPSPSSGHRPHNPSHAQPRHSAGLPVWRRNTVHSPLGKRRRTGQTATHQFWHQTPMPTAGSSRGDVVSHRKQPFQRSSQLQNEAQMGTRSQQTDPSGCRPPVADRPQDSGVESGQPAQAHVAVDEPSSSGNHPRQSAALSGASLAATKQPGYEPAAALDVCKASSLAPDPVVGVAPKTGTAEHNAGRHRNIPSTAGRQGHPMSLLSPSVHHAQGQTQASPLHASSARPQLSDAMPPLSDPQADGPAARHHADTAEPDKTRKASPHATSQSEGHRPASGCNIGDPAARRSSTGSPMPEKDPAARGSPAGSPMPETVRAADSDDDVEIMDSPLSPEFLAQAMAPDSDGCTGQQAKQQARTNVLLSGTADEDLPPCNQEQQLPHQQHCTDQDEQDVSAWKHQRHQQPRQHQQSLGERSQQPQQQKQEQEQRRPPIKISQQPQQQEQQQSSWQQNPQEQPHQQHDQAGSHLPLLSPLPTDLPSLSHLAQQILSAAGRQCPPAADSTAVKQEPARSQPGNSTHMPCSGQTPQNPQEAVAGSSSTHPLELSESDDSSASSSMDPSQRVPAPWLHADTAASRRQEGAVGGVLGAVGAAHVLLRQASQGSTLTGGHLRTKR